MNAEQSADASERPLDGLVGRLTAKQRDFIAACDRSYQDGYTPDGKPNIVKMPYCFSIMAWSEWGFWTKSDAERFVSRLVQRGLIRTDKDPFYWATDAGRAAIAPPNAKSTGAAHHEQEQE